MEQPKEFYAFISYKREDEKWAKWLQDKLEHYKFPTNLNGWIGLPKKIYPTFRDVTDLNPGVLAEEIDKALCNSQWLIVVCSPRSAKSPWVCKEAQTFIDQGRADHIIPFVIEGTPFSKDPVNECYPEALLNLTGSKELLATNINEMGRDAAMVKVVARMFGLRFDTLWQRYEREKRKQRRLIWGGILGLAFSALIVAGWLWNLNTQLANKNRQLSIENIKVGSREIVGLLDKGDYVEAIHGLWDLLKIWQADFREEAPEFEQALRAMYRYESTDGIVKIFSVPISNSQSYLSSDSSYIYIRDIKEWQDEILRVDIESGKYEGKVFPTKAQRDTTEVLEMKGHKVLYYTSRNIKQKASLRMYDFESGNDIQLTEQRTLSWILSDDYILVTNSIHHVDDQKSADLITIKKGRVAKRDSIPLPFFPEKAVLKGDTLIIAQGTHIATWLIKQQRWVNRLNYRVDDKNAYEAEKVLAISPACSRIANTRYKNGLVLFSTDRQDSVVINPKLNFASVAFNPRGTMMAVTDTFSDSLVIYVTEGMRPAFRLSSVYLDGVDVDFIGDNALVAYRSGYMLSMYDIEANFNTSLLFSHDGRYRLDAADGRKTIEIVNDSTNEKVLRITGVDNWFQVYGFSPRGKYLKIGTLTEDYALLDFNNQEVISVIPNNGIIRISEFKAERVSEDEGTIAFLKEGNPYYKESDTLMIYNVAKDTMRVYVPYKDLQGIALNYDGSQLAMYGSQGVSLLHIDSLSISPHQYPSPIPTFSQTNLSVHDVCFTPDGKHLLISYSDGSLRCWDIETGCTSSPTMRSEEGIVYGMINVSPDGQYVIGTSSKIKEKQVHDIWRIASGCRVDRLTNEWSWFLKPFLSNNYIYPNYEAVFCSDGSPYVIINERRLIGLSRIFDFPSFEELVKLYSEELERTMSRKAEFVKE